MSTYYLQEASKCAKQAVECDLVGDLSRAQHFYQEAAKYLQSAEEHGTKPGNLESKIQEYISRAQELGNQMLLDAEVARAKSLIEGAFKEEAKKNKKGAFNAYLEAAELCQKILSQTSDADLVQNLRKMAVESIGRAEAIKPTLEQSKSNKTNPEVKPTIPGPLGFSLRETSPNRVSKGSATTGAGGSAGGSRGGYTKEELDVLRKTSYINAREYVPFMAEVDNNLEKFNYPLPFSDKDGLLILSPKQKNNFSNWVRSSELSPDPKMIVNMSCFSIRQTIVSDCSFVASLAISAQYERRFNRKLISNIIYPQNKTGDPVYNHSGKYMIKLHINGVIRKVIIDDFLPIGREGELLCSFSTNRNELWVSLLEKAYMKVMGGYDFPGSNSNIDLHALTGWIPERISMSSKSIPFDADKQFRKVHDRFHMGHCLITMATGELPKEEADRAGLVPSHAYAMLDVQEFQGKRLFQLKNPWSHVRWRGNFSELDVKNWTPDFLKRLNYDLEKAASNDDGIFWIDYDSLRHFFDVIYINWNPDIFAFTSCLHHTWSAKDGPKKDTYNMGENPQYKLEVPCGNQQAGVWILLSRHITDKDDFADNKEFITVFVYKANGKRVYYGNEPPPFKDGVKINSPHYLCTLKAGPGNETFTLVVSQYEKSNTINYTLRIYATTKFKMTKLEPPNKFKKEVTGEWKGRTAGGCRNHDTYNNNPRYELRIDNKLTINHVLIELKAPSAFNVGFEIEKLNDSPPEDPSHFGRKSSGDFRRGFCYLELENVHGGAYVIQPSTYLPSQEGPFFLLASSNSQISLKRYSA